MPFDSTDPDNQRLLSHVRPSAWVPPTPLARYDLVVVGGGTAGLVAAHGAAGVGAQVALIERDRLGGDCLNSGCVPSKTLLAAAADAVHTRGMDGAPAASRPTPHPAMARLRAARAAIAPHDGVARAEAAGVHVFFGEAAFTSPDVVEVAGLRLPFRRALIATGARPVRPDVGIVDGPGIFTTDSIFEAPQPPAEIVVAGGGAVGCEIAQAFARLGSTVSLVEAAPYLLPREDEDAAAVVHEALRADGVRVLTGTTLGHVDRRGDRLQLTLVRGGTSETHDTPALLFAMGRAPHVEGLRLDRAGVTTDARGRVAVDDRLRTANPRIYAAGDVCLPWQFTHAADASARIVVRNALFAGRRRLSRLVVPRVTFTDPEVAAVGLTVADARESGTATDRFEVSLMDLDRAVTDGRTRGFTRLLVRRGSDRIVGATIVGPRAGEVIGEVSLAMQAGVGLGRLSEMVRAYPTYGGAIGRAADAYARTRLTPRVARLLAGWLAWRRRLGRH